MHGLRSSTRQLQSTRLVRRAQFLARILQIRLRLLLAVLAVFALGAGWRTMGERWDELMGWLAHRGHAAPSVGVQVEFFCPMCPGVLSTWPEKCPVCKMPLVRRSKMDAAGLPDGVIARMQLTPYRVQLAGIRTSEVAYRPLLHVERVTARVVRCGRSDDELAGRGTRLIQADSAALEPGNLPAAVVEVATGNRQGRTAAAEIDGAPAGRRLRVLMASRDRASAMASQRVILRRIGPAGEDIAAVLTELAAADQSTDTLIADIVAQSDLEPLPAGRYLDLRLERPMAEIEPFRSQPRNAPPRAAGDPVRVYFSERAPDRFFMRPGKSPFQDGELQDRKLLVNERVLWWSPAAPGRAPGGRDDYLPEIPSTMVFPTIVAFAPEGQVLAVPEAAVIENVDGQIVFVEAMPGMYDAVRVELGPASGGYRGVIRGLQPGQRVVSAGAFLLDAETRLNPALAAGYFGAGSVAAEARGSAVATSSTETAADLTALRELTTQERRLAEWQRICPVTRAPLGSMGELVRVEFQDTLLLLCCAGCSDRIPGGRLVEPERADDSDRSDAAAVPQLPP